MTESDRRAVWRLVGGDSRPRATTDDLHGLLLQVVFALLMVRSEEHTSELQSP